MENILHDLETWIYETTAINQILIVTSLCILLFWRCAPRRLKSCSYHPLELADRTFLSFYQNYKRELVSSVHNRGNNELTVDQVIWPNLILILSRILKKLSKLERLKCGNVDDYIVCSEVFVFIKNTKTWISSDLNP